MSSFVCCVGGLERGRRLQTARPRLDVLVVLRSVERVEDRARRRPARTGCAGTSRGARPRSSPPDRRRRSRNRACPGGRGAPAARDRSDRAGRRDRAPRRTSCRSRSPGRCRPGLLLARLELGEAHALERGDRVVDRVVAQRLESGSRSARLRRPGSAARRRHVVRGGVGVLVEVVEIDLGEVEVDLVRASARLPNFVR